MKKHFEQFLLLVMISYNNGLGGVGDGDDDDKNDDDNDDHDDDNSELDDSLCS